MSFLDKLVKLVGDDMCSIAVNGTISDNDVYIDTGSYTLNALLSGSIFKGHPANKTSALAAEEAAGKTYIVLQVISQFLIDNPTGNVVLNDTEGAIDKDMLIARGIDASRVLIINPDTLETFRNKNHQIIQEYLQLPKKERVPMLMACDSLTQLPSVKEMSDSGDDKTSGDMGMRAKVIRATFRVLRLSLSKAKIPMIVTNHVYKSTGMFPTTEVAGGGGLKYAADIILTLRKEKDIAKEKDAASNTKQVYGVIVHGQAAKSRLVKQFSTAKFYISYTKGIDRYYGLLDWALECGVFQRAPKHIIVPSGKKVLQSEIIKNPTEYYTQEVLEKIDEWVQLKFGYGKGVEGSIDSDIEVEEE